MRKKKRGQCHGLGVLVHNNSSGGVYSIDERHNTRVYKRVECDYPDIQTNLT